MNFKFICIQSLIFMMKMKIVWSDARRRKMETSEIVDNKSTIYVRSLHLYLYMGCLEPSFNGPAINSTTRINLSSILFISNSSYFPAIWSDCIAWIRNSRVCAKSVLECGGSCSGWPIFRTRRWMFAFIIIIIISIDHWNGIRALKTM